VESASVGAFEIAPV
jgi:hypothetical protein